VYQPTSKSPPGFTLIEVLITLVIIAIVAGISAPAILSMAPNMALKSAAQELYSTFQEAKIAAIKENRDVGVRFGTAGFTLGEPFTDDGNGLYDGEAYVDSNGDGLFTSEKEVVFADEYGYDFTTGTGNATADWDDKACSDAISACNTLTASITFNSRGTSNADSAFLFNRNNNIDNSNNDMCYAVTVNVAGSVKIRKYNGALPFNKNNWVE